MNFKMPSEKFRKDMFKSKRKLLEEIWQGEYAMFERTLAEAEEDDEAEKTLFVTITWR